MRKIALALGFAVGLGGLAIGTADNAEARTCVRNAYGHVVCGSDVRRDYRERRYDRGGPYAMAPRGAVRPVGSVHCDRFGRCFRSAPHSCTHPGFTIQDGVCKPYRGY